MIQLRTQVFSGISALRKLVLKPFDRLNETSQLLSVMLSKPALSVNEGSKHQTRLNSQRPLITLMFLLLSLTSVLQAEFDKVATTAAPFLKMGVGARASAMGGGFVALANDGTALYWNPAGMLGLQNMTATASHNDWLLDITHEYVSLIIPGRQNERIGLSVSALTMGEQPVRTLEAPEGTGLVYGVMDLAVSAGYARQVTDRLSMGITGKFIQLQAFNESASTLALDIGSILQTDFYGLKIGMVLSNFGGDIQFSGRDLILKADIDDDINGNYSSDVDLRTDPWPLPLLIRIGVSMDVIGPADALLKSHLSRLTLALDADHPNDGPEHLNFGAEYALRELVYFRGGYRYNYDQEAWTMGVGIHLNGQHGQIKLDYAVKPMEVFGNTSILSVEFSK
ncbi:MAG: PorV/PorQ family protein [Candidatus Marinimicrobia bacterium]|nr:PorV/PorQ family protein [Candidatus Neomarinimicrobiota bacterium]